jgi:hypothetical protein
MNSASDIKEEMPSEFEKDLTALINRHSLENGSNTPDFILASYLRSCLDNFNRISRWREKWYGKALSVGGVKEFYPPQELPPTETPTIPGSIRVCKKCGTYLAQRGCCGRIFADCHKCEIQSTAAPQISFDLACRAFNEQAQKSAPPSLPRCKRCGDHLVIIKRAPNDFAARCSKCKEFEETAGFTDPYTACHTFNNNISSPAPRPVATDACADHSPVSGTHDESASPAPSRGDVS